MHYKSAVLGRHVLSGAGVMAAVNHSMKPSLK
jgi:hypothetical protein